MGMHSIVIAPHQETIINFNIVAGGAVSIAFTELGITDFAAAAMYVRRLPYARNKDKTAILCPLTEQCGTCSTKHALLKQLAIEHNVDNVKLTLGIFKMNGANAVEVTDTLARYELDHIPEAHNYLTIDNRVLDCTKTEWIVPAFIADLLLETEILPHQVTGYKVDLHREFLTKWLDDNKHIPYSLDELFAIREECILDLFSTKIPVL